MKIKMPGGGEIERDTVLDVKRLFDDEALLQMVRDKLTACMDNCKNYPLMDKDRTVTIKMKLKPDIDKDAVMRNDFDYRRAVYTVSVSGPALPETSVQYACGITNGGLPFYNRDSPADPMQQTFEFSE